MPADNPRAFGSGDRDADFSDRPAQRSLGRERPVGISILALLHIAGGIVLGIMQLVLLANLDKLEPLRTIGIPPVLLMIGIAFLALLGTAAGFGMWRGAKWGWWLGAFYYVYSMARNATALVAIAELADDAAGGSRGPGYYYVKHGGRILVHFLILLYFFKENVLGYFGLDDISKPRAISVLVGVCLAIIGIVNAIAWFSS